jgi:hypothetical protein
MVLTDGWGNREIDKPSSSARIKVVVAAPEGTS